MRNKEELPLSEILKTIIQTNRLKYGIRKVEIREIWEKIMGNGIINYTKEIDLKGNILYVSITSASLRQELSYGTDKIIKIINEEFDEEVVSKIIWK